MTKDQILAALRVGRDRVARGWCVLNFAQNSLGGACHPSSPEAVRWCARGAVGSEWESGINSEVEAVLYEALPQKDMKGRPDPGDVVAAFNNCGTQADVIALFDRAIASLKPKLRSDSVLVADLLERIVGQTVSTEAQSEELTW